MLAGEPYKTKLNPGKPDKIEKLVFIHHSCGSNWLRDNNGGLGKALMKNNYFVSSTNYGWGPDKIGNLTDIGHWWNWFRSENGPEYMEALYNLNEKNCEYTRNDEIPDGENDIIMFKSCYPNSIVKGKKDDPVTDIASNPLRGKAFNTEFHTLANIKSIYIDILEYFMIRQDKLFILVTAPPVQDEEYADNARALNNWLVYEWLKDYEYNNVGVFDFYNVLTSSKDEEGINDLDSENGNHHRFKNGKIEHINGFGSNTSKYPVGANDDHPCASGNIKATVEFLDLLNIYFNLWKSK